MARSVPAIVHRDGGARPIDLGRNDPGLDFADCLYRQIFSFRRAWSNARNARISIGISGEPFILANNRSIGHFDAWWSAARVAGASKDRLPNREMQPCAVHKVLETNEQALENVGIPSRVNFVLEEENDMSATLKCVSGRDSRDPRTTTSISFPLFVRRLIQHCGSILYLCQHFPKFFFPRQLHDCLRSALSSRNKHVHDDNEVHCESNP